MIEELRHFCLKKPYVTESFPFDESSLVFKVHGKMFALLAPFENKPQV
jgi:predicted DNA-binding protein (MmcQ/YjbR family)